MATKLGLSNQPSAADDAEIRLGNLALKSGLVTELQLREALSVQAKEALAGRQPPLLGTILVAAQFVTQEQVDLLLREQKERRAQAQS